ncbi:MAG: cobaltochelatase subunit CobN, partial [Methanosarcinaceae archaeon]
SSNTYGGMDTDDFFQYVGGLGLVIEQASGTIPDTYIMNLQNPDAEKIETLKSYLSREIITRYLNPNWIEGMQQHGFEGAGQMGDFIENLWGWEALNPDLIGDHVWNDVYRTYFSDSETSKWIKEANPYGYQSMTARMIETARKGNWDASDDTIRSLVSDYVKTVVETGDVTCCHHTCGNPLLDSYIQGVMSIPGVVSEETAAEYNRLMQEATQRETSSSDSTTATGSSSGSVGDPKVVKATDSGSGNQTQVNDAGYGTTTDQVPLQSTPDDYVEGYEMTKESTSSESSSSSSFSGADIVGSILVLAAVGVMYAGFRRRKI